MERIPDFILSEEGAEGLGLLAFRLLRTLVANELLPALNRTLKLDVLFTLFLRRYRLFVIDKEQDD